MDIGIGQDQYNTGNTLMSVGIVLLEVGSAPIESPFKGNTLTIAAPEQLDPVQGRAYCVDR